MEINKIQWVPLPDPFEQFSVWFEEARAVIPKYPEAMTLATCGASGRPSSRVVLLKAVRAGGFHFFTNYESRKGREILENPFAALTFYWSALDRQVRIEGRLEKLSREDSESYFHSRPRESQISAWASPQSQVIENREVLEAKISEIQARFESQVIPLPPFWGGFRLMPESFEFWLEVPNRRHDRVAYLLTTDHKWQIARLAP